MHATENPPTSAPVSLAILERVESLWYPDGNLVIHAGSVIFRVYRGMLAKQSPVLGELLHPSKLSRYDVFDGCTVLHLPYSGTETIYFLAAIFDANSFDPLLRHIDFDSIAAVLRLSSDYQIAPLKRKALKLLSSLYKTTLPEFGRAGLEPSYCRDQIIPVIRFAREHSIDWILPLALYRFCLEMTGQNLVEGVEYGGIRLKLSPEDQIRCFDAGAAMRSANTAQILARYETRLSHAGCTGGDACRQSRFREADTLLYRLPDLPALAECWAPEPDSKLCQGCREDMFQWHANRRRSFWDGLPGLFGLPDWTVLNEMKSIAQAFENLEEDEELHEIRLSLPKYSAASTSTSASPPLYKSRNSALEETQHVSINLLELEPLVATPITSARGGSVESTHVESTHARTRLLLVGGGGRGDAVARAVVRVHLAHDVDLAVGVEACSELVALVAEVGLRRKAGLQRERLLTPDEGREHRQPPRAPNLIFERYVGDLGNDFEGAVTRYVAYVHACTVET
ncbi:hypothetical protein C8R44DRAFT_855384 [Mycena epipterygia]|nr:hypothetical protein C8R44DRAFT_855384 [Mycena epipterygia]